MSSNTCQICHVNPATIHHTDLTGGNKVETHVCEACAAAHGVANEGGFVANLMDVARGIQARAESCPHCGITFEEFRSKGRFGCPRDYEVFREALVPLLQKMHGGAQRHVGRLPHGQDEVETTVSDRLLQLRRELQEAVEQEKYEDAARLRDEIAEIERASKQGRPWTSA